MLARRLLASQSGTFGAFFTKSVVPSCACFTNVALYVDRLGDSLGQERGVAEVVGFVFVLAPAAPLTRDVRVPETGCIHVRGGGGGDIVVR